MDGIQEAVGELIVALKASSNRLLKMIEKSRNDLKGFVSDGLSKAQRTVCGRSADGQRTVRLFQIKVKAHILNKSIIHARMKMEKINGKKHQKIIS